MAPSRSATQYADLLLSGAGERRPITVPAAVEFAAGGGLANLLIGPILQCLEAATLGQPFEVGATISYSQQFHAASIKESSEALFKGAHPLFGLPMSSVVEIRRKANLLPK